MCLFQKNSVQELLTESFHCLIEEVDNCVSSSQKDTLPARHGIESAAPSLTKDGAGTVENNITRNSVVERRVMLLLVILKILAKV